MLSNPRRCDKHGSGLCSLISVVNTSVAITSVVKFYLTEQEYVKYLGNLWILASIKSLSRERG